MIASTLGFLARISRVIFGGSGPRSGLHVPGDDFKAVNVTLLDLLRVMSFDRGDLFARGDLVPALVLFWCVGAELL